MIRKSELFLSPAPILNWVIFCCGNLLLYQKVMKMMKTQIFWWITTKERQKVICKHKPNSLLWTCPLNPWCNMLQTLERQGENIGDKKPSMERNWLTLIKIILAFTRIGLKKFSKLIFKQSVMFLSNKLSFTKRFEKHFAWETFSNAQWGMTCFSYLTRTYL